MTKSGIIYQDYDEAAIAENNEDYVNDLFQLVNGFNLSEQTKVVLIDLMRKNRSEFETFFKNHKSLNYGDKIG